MVYVSTPNPPHIPDTAAERCGVQRGSMRTNLLIHRAGLGECNKLTFTNPPNERCFGVPKQADPEGARELTMLWKEHKANPRTLRPGPDYLSMNKNAAIKGLTSAPQQHQFRTDHPACLKNGEAVKKAAPLLPSDVDTEHIYGMPGTHRTAEQIRNAGNCDPPMKPLIQSQYSNTWITMNRARAHEFDKRKAYISPTRGPNTAPGATAGMYIDEVLHGTGGGRLGDKPFHNEHLDDFVQVKLRKLQRRSN